MQNGRSYSIPQKPEHWAGIGAWHSTCEWLGSNLSPKRDALLFEVDSYAPNVIANLAARATDHYAGKGSPVAFTDLSVRFIKKGEMVNGKR